MTIRVLVAEDQELVRAGARDFVRDTLIQVAGEVRNAADLQAMVQADPPDLVLLSPEIRGALDLLAQWKRTFPDVPVLLFSTYSVPSLVACAVEAGAAAVMSKEVSREEFIELLTKAAMKNVLWTRDDLRRATLSADRGSPDLDVQLTRRESDVMRKMVDGLTNKEIAVSLDISYETVKEHVQHILQKVGVTDRTQAAVWAVRHGLV